MEAPTRTILHAENLDLIKGHKIIKNAPSITHLLFADDCLVFCEANSQANNNLVKFFSDFGKALDQLINLNKSEVFFSANTDAEIMNGIQTNMNIKTISLEDKYLGPPCLHIDPKLSVSNQ